MLGQIHKEETLDDLDMDDVFKRCLDVHKIPEEQRLELFRSYHETILSLYENDTQTE